MPHCPLKRTPAALLAAAGLLLPLAACSDDSGDETTDTTAAGTAETTAGDDGATDTTAAPAAPAGGADEIVISGFIFSEATVAPGATVVVANEDGAPHTVTSDDESWEAVEVSGAGVGEFTAPSEPGTYDFHCEIHSTMTATLTVE